MKRIFKVLLSRNFIEFLFSGGIAAVVNFLSRIVFNLFISYTWSVVLAYIMGMITAFTLMRLFVYRNESDFDKELKQQVFYFIIVNLIAIVQTVFFSYLCNYYLFPYLGFNFYRAEVAHAVGIVIPTFTSFIGHKHFTFSSRIHKVKGEN